MKSGGIQKQLFQTENLIVKYRSTVMGSGGWVALAYYEMMILALSPIPGKTGERLRRVLYPCLFDYVGKNVYFGKSLSFIRPDRISIGNGVVIRDRVHLNVHEEGDGIRIADHVIIGSGTMLNCTGGTIQIGVGSRIDRHCRLGSRKGLTVGERLTMGEESCIVGAGHAHDNLDIPMIDQFKTCAGPTFIGNGVLIGDRATLLDGVNIGDNVAIDDETLVNKNLPANCHAYGVPATWRYRQESK